MFVMDRRGEAGGKAALEAKCGAARAHHTDSALKISRAA